MATDHLVIRAEEIEEFVPPGAEGVYVSKCLIDRDGAGSERLNVNMGIVKAGQQLHGGSHPVGADECYWIVRGKGDLALGGDPATGEGGEVYAVEPETAVWIPGNTYHALNNPYDEDLVILTIWAKRPKPGDNSVYDARIQAWGTSFRKKSSASR